MNTKFATSTTQSGFSGDGGAWGAASGSVNGRDNANNRPKNYWGVANWHASDNECYKIYKNGALVSASTSATKVYMYYNMETTEQPTLAPVPNPTYMPVVPSRTPTSAPNVNPTQGLFAVVGGDSCSQDLYYGPQAITTRGSVDDQHPYFVSTSTDMKDVPHNHWLQIVTSDGTNELFRVYWTFLKPRSLAERFFVREYDEIRFTVVLKSGVQYIDTCLWVFSGSGRPQPIADKFTTTTTTVPFSESTAVWGVGNGFIEDYDVPSWFWGIGSFGDGDKDDKDECFKVYQNGVASTTYGKDVKAYMYASAAQFASPVTTWDIVSLQAEQVCVCVCVCGCMMDGLC